MKDTFKTIGALLLIGAAKSFANTSVAVLEKKAGEATNPFAVTGWQTAAGTLVSIAPVLDGLGAELAKKLTGASGEPAPAATYTAP